MRRGGYAYYTCVMVSFIEVGTWEGAGERNVHQDCDDLDV